MRMFGFFLVACLLPLAVMAGEAVDYKIDGKTYEGYSAKATGSSKGLVLIVHDWDGVDEYEMKRAQMVADLGYDAFAVDLFGKGNRPTTTDGKKAASGALRKNRVEMRKRMAAGLETAQKLHRGKTVVMGYCFGGDGVLELARGGHASNVVGYATFHGATPTPAGQSYPKSTPPIFIAHGGGDTSITMEHMASVSKDLEAAGISYEMQVYSGAPHAFTVIGSGRYRKVADQQSWNAFQDFLKTNLGGM